jgi:hypothetical protein
MTEASNMTLDNVIASGVPAEYGEMLQNGTAAWTGDVAP